MENNLNNNENETAEEILTAEPTGEGEINVASGSEDVDSTAEVEMKEITMEKPKKENKAKVPKTKKEKGGNGLIIGLLAFMSLMLVALIALVVIVLGKNKDYEKKFDEIASSVNAVSVGTTAQDEKISEMNEKLVEITEFTDRLSGLMGEEEMGATSENDVTIGGEYKIVSTEAISDAYKSGDTSLLDDNQLKTLELAEDIIDEVIEDGMTDYEKEVAIYDWMYENIEIDDGITVAIPTTGEYADNPYGVLSVKKAVCVGYATTFRLFMQMLDIDCMVVHDTYLSHSWDLVKIDDNWYHTDVYMDIDSVRYGNFNMTDDMCFEGHEWDDSFFPNADSVEYCYAVVSSKDFISLENTAKELRNLVEAEEDGRLSYKLTGDDMYITYQQLELMIGKIDEYVISSDINDYGYMEWNALLVDDTTLVFCVSFDYYNDEDDDWDEEYPDDKELTDDDIQDAYDAVEKVFGDFYDEHKEYDGEGDGWFGDWSYDDMYEEYDR